MEVPKLTKAFVWKKDKMNKGFITDSHIWYKYDFGKPLKPVNNPTLVLTLEFIVSDVNRKNVFGSYEVRFEYTTLEEYNPLQICQLFHKATEIGVDDFKDYFIKDGYNEYDLEKIISPTFEEVFPTLKELYYPLNFDMN